DISEESFLQLQGGFIQQPLPRESPEADANSLERAVYNTVTGGLSYDQRVSNWRNLARASVQQIAYISRASAGRSYTLQTYSDRVSYGLSGQLNLFLQGSYAHENWVRQPALRNADYWTGHLGVSFEIPEVIEGEIGVGVVRHAYDHNTANPLVTPSFSAQLT